jgi:hypothetical protein
LEREFEFRIDRKEIKLFYLADYNLGEKATDLVSSNVMENDIFGEDRLSILLNLYLLLIVTKLIFSKTQSILICVLNSLSFTKIKKIFLLGSAYLNDIQNQNSFAETNYNFDLIQFLLKNSFITAEIRLHQQN